MKTKSSPSSNFFGVLTVVLPLAFLMLSSLTNKDPVVKKEVTSASSNELFSCTQADLIICSYSTIEDFVDALVAELNNQLNYCGSALVACGSLPCCYYNTADITFTSALSSGKNPFFYCTHESCNSFTCSTLSGGGSQHNDLTVANQNEILTRMRSAANSAAGCGAGNSSAISGYRVYKTGNPNDTCSSDGPCYNISIKLEVTYLCICQNHN